MSTVQRSILPHNWNVPEIFRKRLGDKPGRQRTMSADGHLLLVLHAPPNADEVERTGRFYWREPDGTWHSSEKGAGPGTLDNHLESYAKLIEQNNQQEEQAISANDYFGVLQAVTPLQRSSRNMHQVFQTARETCPEDRNLINCRDKAYEIERNADLLYQDVKNGLDFALLKREEEQAKTSMQMATSAHRLNLLAAFFFPLATLSSLCSINLQYPIQEMVTHPLFLGMVIAGIVSGILLTGFITRPGQASKEK